MNTCAIDCPSKEFDVLNHAMALVGIAGEWAAERAQTEGPGTFRVKFLDSFDSLELGNFASANIREISKL